MPSQEARVANPANRFVSAMGAAGSLMAALAVGLSAYAAHAVAGEARQRLLLAAAFALVHGIALAALSPHASRRVGRWALALLLTGTLLFSGSLAGAVLFGFSTALAPLGGTLMMAGWLLHGVGRLRS